MNKLYPLTFVPSLKQKTWGGSRLAEVYGKPAPEGVLIGESWEICGFGQDVSLVADGFLRGNTLEELIEVYMGELVGESVYARFGNSFPLLIKFLDTREWLSVQVHPDDEMAKRYHGGFGKSEMWYIMQADEQAEIINGLREEVNEEDFRRSGSASEIMAALRKKQVHKGDVFDIPAGRIHAIGPGISLCEIQQASDITYRLYDWDRKDAGGQARELHTDMALKALKGNREFPFKIPYKTKTNQSVTLVSNPYFHTQLIELDKYVDTDYYYLDSFVILIVVEGKCWLGGAGFDLPLKTGELVLVPAEVKQLRITPAEKARLLQVYIPQ